MRVINFWKHLKRHPHTWVGDSGKLQMILDGFWEFLKILLYKLICSILERILGLFSYYFQKLFFIFHNKKHKKLDWERGHVFIFYVFRVLKNHFFENNEKMFLLFFYCSNNRLFFVFFLHSFCVFLTAFYISTKISSTQLPHSHLQALSSSLNY